MKNATIIMEPTDDPCGLRIAQSHVIRDKDWVRSVAGVIESLAGRYKPVLRVSRVTSSKYWEVTLDTPVTQHHVSTIKRYLESGFHGSSCVSEVNVNMDNFPTTAPTHVLIKAPVLEPASVPSSVVDGAREQLKKLSKKMEELAKEVKERTAELDVLKRELASADKASAEIIVWLRENGFSDDE